MGPAAFGFNKSPRMYKLGSTTGQELVPGFAGPTDSRLVQRLVIRKGKGWEESWRGLCLNMAEILGNSIWWVLAVFIAYFAGLIAIAVGRSRQMRDMDDYVLGGRRLGVVTSALSSGSSAVSGWTMLVFPALAFAAGLLHLWTLVGIVGGAWLAWTVLAKRLRRYTMATGDSLTLPEFLERRFNDGTGALRTLAAVISLYFIVLYVCSGLIAGAKLLEEVFGLDNSGGGHDLGVLITLVAVVSYTFIGGFLAVSRTDVFQALIMLAGFFIIPVSLLIIVDNPFEGLGSTAPGFWNPLTDTDNNPLGLVFFLSSMGWAMGSFGAQRLLARFMAVDRESHINTSRNVSFVWVVLIFALALLTGLVAAPALLDRGVALPDPERLYLVVSSVFFHPVIAGLLLTAVVAAVMSTADSQLLLASAVASDDLPVLKRITASMRTQSRVWMGRLLLVIVGIIAAAVSIVSPDSVFALVSLAWGGMGAAFGPVTILALYWRRFNLWGALSAVVSGAAVSSFWWLMGLGSEAPRSLTEALGFGATVKYLEAAGAWHMQPAVPGFVAACVFAVAVTLLTAAPEREVTDLFDHVNGPDWVEPSLGAEPAAD